jgi:hypothetical protein
VDRPLEISAASSVDATHDTVWNSISTMNGVNDELHPLVRMTSPREHHALPTEVDGSVVFKSWLLLFGIMPFDRHALALVTVDAGVGFVEESSSWLQRRWRHERTVTPTARGGCTIDDHLVIEPRFRLLRPVVSVVVRQLFAHRHRRLVRRFGGSPSSSNG